MRPSLPCAHANSTEKRERARPRRTGVDAVDEAAFWRMSRKSRLCSGRANRRRAPCCRAAAGKTAARNAAAARAVRASHNPGDVRKGLHVAGGLIAPPASRPPASTVACQPPNARSIDARTCCALNCPPPRSSPDRADRLGIIRLGLIERDALHPGDRRSRSSGSLNGSNFAPPLQPMLCELLSSVCSVSIARRRTTSTRLIEPA